MRMFWNMWAIGIRRRAPIRDWPFQGWSTSQYQNPNDAISATTYVTLYAEYDKGVAFGSYTYLNGQRKVENIGRDAAAFLKRTRASHTEICMMRGQKYTPSDLSGEVSLKEWTYIAAYSGR